MNTIEIIIFLIVFVSLVLGLSIKGAKNEAKREKQKFTNRETLEVENTEFDYGHNIKHNSEIYE